MANTWLVPYFDYTLKKYDNTYHSLATISYFVDSKNGSDVAAGTRDAPFKTMGKAQTVGSNGQLIMINGYFYETLSLTKTIRWIGAGGGLGGRAIFGGNITMSSVSNIYIDNIIVYSNSNYFYNITSAISTYNSNCIFPATGIQGTNYVLSMYCYYTIFHTVYFTTPGTSTGLNMRIYGNNNTIYNCTRRGYVYELRFYGDNNHCNNSIMDSVVGYNNIQNVNGQYLDPTNWNFNFLNTSPLYRTGTFNGDVGNYNHVGAGSEGLNKNGSSSELTAAGGATLTNISLSGSELYRPNVTIDGTLLTYYIDLGSVRDKVLFDFFNTFVQTTGTLNRLIQESAGLTVRNQLDYILKYGNTTAEVDACPALVMEQGKIVTVSGSGASRLGNCDPLFDVANYTFPSFQYAVIQFREKTV